MAIISAAPFKASEMTLTTRFKAIQDIVEKLMTTEAGSPDLLATHGIFRVSGSTEAVSELLRRYAMAFLEDDEPIAKIEKDLTVNRKAYTLTVADWVSALKAIYRTLALDSKTSSEREVRPVLDAFLAKDGSDKAFQVGQALKDFVLLSIQRAGEQNFDSAGAGAAAAANIVVPAGEILFRAKALQYAFVLAAKVVRRSEDLVSSSGELIRKGNEMNMDNIAIAFLAPAMTTIFCLRDEELLDMTAIFQKVAVSLLKDASFIEQLGVKNELPGATGSQSKAIDVHRIQELTKRVALGNGLLENMGAAPSLPRERSLSLRRIRAQLPSARRKRAALKDYQSTVLANLQNDKDSLSIHDQALLASKLAQSERLSLAASIGAKDPLWDKAKQSQEPVDESDDDSKDLQARLDALCLDSALVAADSGLTAPSAAPQPEDSSDSSSSLSSSSSFDYSSDDGETVLVDDSKGDSVKAAQSHSKRKPSR